MGPKNEHPRCGCKSCKRGASSTAGKLVHRAINRAIRRRNAKLLADLVRSGEPEEDDKLPVRVSTPYTD